MSIRRRRKNIKVQSSGRPRRCFLGDANNALYNASSGGSTYTGPLYSNYHNRLNEEWCMAYYKASRYSPMCVQSISFLDILGWEEIVGVKGRRQGMNNCAHRTFGTVNLPFLVMYRDYLNSSLYFYKDYNRRATTRGLALYLGQQVDELRTKYAPGFDKFFSARAFWSMRPKFEGEVSIINSIFELKDFKDVLNLRKIYNNFRNVSSSNLFSGYKREFNKLARDQNIHATLREKGIGSYAELTPGALNLLARDVSGTAAAGVLTMNLAVKPTIQDVMAIAAQLATSAEERQNVFNQYGELGSRSHFSENTVRGSSTQPTKNNYLYAEGSHYKIKQTATMRSFYLYKMRTLNQALVRYWGLAGSVEALWNMLPMSFVLDYVFTIGKSLAYMDRDNNVDLVTQEYCESVKIECTDGLHIPHNSSIAALVIDGKYYKPSTKGTPLFVSGTRATRYTRRVMDPYKGPALPKFKMPSTTQAENILALVRCFVN